MEHGTYKDKIDFVGFAVSKFVPHLRSGIAAQYCGCGTTALSLLTGENPYDMYNKFGEKDHFSDRFMLNYLKSRGFRYQKLTRCGITKGKYIEYPLTKDHVVLISVMLINKNASWEVLHNKLIFHNYEITPITTYEFVNHPILSAYLVSHPTWMDKSSKVMP